MCLAEFAAYCYKDYKSDVSETMEAQPEILSDGIIAQLHQNLNHSTSLPGKIRLMNGKEVMKCRKVKAVIRYHTPNKTKEPEKYFHHLLMLYYPWRQETELLGNEQTYMSKFYEPEVQAVVEHNKNTFELDSDAVTEALETLRNSDITTLCSYDTINDQENEDLQSHIHDHLSDAESFHIQPSQHLDPQTSYEQAPGGAITSYNQPLGISDDNLRQSVRSLNSQQRRAYDKLLSWCRNKVKNMNSLKQTDVQPVYLFLRGGGGVGKSHLINSIYHTTTKTFRHGITNTENPTVLLMAPTGVAAININGTTIHTALAIPKESGHNLPVSIITLGDLYQLPPIHQRLVFEEYKNNVHNLCHPWLVFKMIELTDDKNFKICLLNIRSLQKHSIDIKHDENLNKCDILALTETQLLPHHSDNTITDTLHPYARHRQDHPTDKCSSLAICTKSNINLLQKQYFPSINGLICNVLITNTNKELKFLLTYRKNNSNIQQYLHNLNNILQTNTVDIILGDFNINYFNELLILLNCLFCH